MFDASSPETRKRDPLALVSIEDATLAGEAVAHVQKLGFRVEKASTMRDAHHLLRTRNYDLIILPTRFEGRGMEENALLLDLVSLPSESRRFRFFVLVGPELGTMDEMEAFLYSMDMTFNVSDMPDFGAYLQMGLGRKQESLAKFSEISRIEDLS